MARRKRRIWDELLEAGRRALREIDELLKPRSPAPVPAPIPKRRGKTRPPLSPG